MNETEKNEEDLMNSTSTFFIETAIVTGISPLTPGVSARQPSSRRTFGTRRAPVVSDPEDRFVEELLSTFGDRWEW